MAETTSARPYLVMCEGNVVGEYETHEDAHDMASVWNHAYPTPPYPEFTVDPECEDEDCPIGCEPSRKGSS